MTSIYEAPSLYGILLDRAPGQIDSRISNQMHRRPQDHHGSSLHMQRQPPSPDKPSSGDVHTPADRTPTVSSLLNADPSSGAGDVSGSYAPRLPPMLAIREAEPVAPSPRLPILEPQTYTWAAARSASTLSIHGPSSFYPTAGPSYGQFGPSHGEASMFRGPSSPGARPSVEASKPLSPWQRVAWKLNIRQQPIAARACGYGNRDRRVIDPPPIVELQAVESSQGGAAIQIAKSGGMIVHSSLYDEKGSRDVTVVRHPSRKQGGRLMGNTVASAAVVRDENDVESVLFAFPDLSCRTYGKYRLCFTLMSINPLTQLTGTAVPTLAQVMSEVFTVYSASEFPGMRPSTALALALKDQGMALPMKKGRHLDTASSRRRTAEEMEEEDDEDGSDGDTG